jgi:hypothetical protein
MTAGCVPTTYIAFNLNLQISLPCSYDLLLVPSIFNRHYHHIDMKHTLLIASFTLPIVYSKTSSQLCEGTGEKASDGNWYCSEVLAITYRNISQTGVYNRTTSVNPSTGICGHETVRYGGTDELTPLFGEVVHSDDISVCVLIRDVGVDAPTRTDEHLPACCVSTSERYAHNAEARHHTVL